MVSPCRTAVFMVSLYELKHGTSKNIAEEMNYSQGEDLQKRKQQNVSFMF